MECDDYLRRSGPHGQLVERYAARLVGDGRVGHGIWRCFNGIGGLLSWIASRRGALAISMNARSSSTSNIGLGSSPSTLATVPR